MRTKMQPFVEIRAEFAGDGKTLPGAYPETGAAEAEPKMLGPLHPIELPNLTNGPSQPYPVLADPDPEETDRGVCSYHLSTPSASRLDSTRSIASATLSSGKAPAARR